ncbi:MAG: GNAT family N-acetyltransferase [Bacteroidaceae bacterium]|nr:GNAT family N-acetyltransferase [Bacteroidaceae bacterium]
MTRLRALEPTDLELLYTIENDPAMWDVGSTATPYSRHALHQHIRTMGTSITDGGELRLVVESNGEAVGLVDLTNYDARSLRAEVSIALLRSYRGRGLGHGALLQLEDYCRRYTHLHQLYALVPSSNEASQALFRGSCYERTAELKDWCFVNGSYQNVELYQRIL